MEVLGAGGSGIVSSLEGGFEGGAFWVVGCIRGRGGVS